MTTRADRIETAAKTLFELDGGTFPQDCTVPEDYRRDAAAVLDAVLPQVTTAEQLEALPAWSVVLSSDGEVWTQVPVDGWEHRGNIRPRSSAAMAGYLPLTVVWQPQPEQETRADA